MNSDVKMTIYFHAHTIKRSKTKTTASTRKFNNKKQQQEDTKERYQCGGENVEPFVATSTVRRGGVAVARRLSDS